VEGYTNFLWVLINVIPHLFDIDVVIFAKVVGIVFGTMSLITTFCIVKSFFIKDNFYAGLAVLFVVTSFNFNYWLVCGLETHIYTFCNFDQYFLFY